MTYSKKQFSDFLTSWMQEVRHLRSQAADESKPTKYVEELVNFLINHNPELENVKQIESDAILFKEHFLSYEAKIQPELDLLKDNYGALVAQDLGADTLYIG